MSLGAHGSGVGLKHRLSVPGHWRSRIVIELENMAAADYDNLECQQNNVGILLECNGGYSNLIQLSFFY